MVDYQPNLSNKGDKMTVKILDVKILDGNDMIDIPGVKWKNPMQLICTNKGNFIDNKPDNINLPNGEYWSDMIGQTVEVKSKPSIIDGLAWLMLLNKEIDENN